MSVSILPQTLTKLVFNRKFSSIQHVTCPLVNSWTVCSEICASLGNTQTNEHVSVTLKTCKTWICVYMFIVHIAIYHALSICTALLFVAIHSFPVTCLFLCTVVGSCSLAGRVPVLPLPVHLYCMCQGPHNDELPSTNTYTCVCVRECVRYT